MDPTKGEQFVQMLVLRVPEFNRSSLDWYRDIPYDAFGTFAIYLRQRIEEGAPEEFLRRAFSVLNDIAKEGSVGARDLLVAGVFEVIADDDRCFRVSLEYLSELAAELLRRTRAGWNWADSSD